MEFDWDPAKNFTNLTKHGISFVAASQVFDDPDHVVMDSTKSGNGEQRFKEIGQLGEKLFTDIFTDRGEFRRIISSRRARTNERREYDQGKEV